MSNKYEGDDIRDLERYKQQIRAFKSGQKIDDHEKRLSKLEQLVTDLLTRVNEMVEKQSA